MTVYVLGACAKCCCPPGPCGVCVGTPCLPLTWTFTAPSSLANGSGCTHCVSYRGNWTLTYNPTLAYVLGGTYTLTPTPQTNCVWDSGDSDPCGGAYPSWVMWATADFYFLIMGGGNATTPAYANSSTMGSVWLVSTTPPFQWTCDLPIGGTNTFLPQSGPANQCANYSQSINVARAS